MFHSTLRLQEGAFLVSDAHYSSTRPELLDFLKSIQSNKLKPTQLLLMGDIFDTLFGGIKKSIQRNQEAIAIINELSQKMEVIYLEGNHDFNIASIFPHVKVFEIKKQPVLCTYEQKKVLLAHGDYDGSLTYKIYTALIRNKFFFMLLSLFDKYLLAKLDAYLLQKDDCKSLDWFEGFIKKRMENRYDVDYFVEGHFHQNKIIKMNTMTYINLAAFACNQRYFSVESSKEKEFLREKSFSKET